MVEAERISRQDEGRVEGPQSRTNHVQVTSEVTAHREKEKSFELMEFLEVKRMEGANQEHE
jgi:hypothetical protein